MAEDHESCGKHTCYVLALPLALSTTTTRNITASYRVDELDWNPRTWWFQCPSVRIVLKSGWKSNKNRCDRSRAWGNCKTPCRRTTFYWNQNGPMQTNLGTDWTSLSTASDGWLFYSGQDAITYAYSKLMSSRPWIMWETLMLCIHSSTGVVYYTKRVI